MTFFEMVKAKLVAWMVPLLMLSLVAAIAGAWFQGRKAGEYAVRYRTADSTVQAIESRGVVHDTQFVHDTVTLRRTRLVTDSVLLHDTVTIPAPVVREIVRNERAACDTAIRASESRCAIKDSLVSALRAKIVLMQHQPGAPRFPSCVAGVGFGTAGKPELAVTCGLRLH